MLSVRVLASGIRSSYYIMLPSPPSTSIREFVKRGVRIEKTGRRTEPDEADIHQPGPPAEHDIEKRSETA